MNTELTDGATSDMVFDTHAEADAEGMRVHDALRAAGFNQGRRPLPAVGSWEGTPGQRGYMLEHGRKGAPGRAFNSHAIMIDHQGPQRETTLDAYEAALRAAGYRVARSLVKWGSKRTHLIVKR